MRARYIKIIVWVVALIIVWNLGQTYTVANSLFVFAAAGVIPGTDIALNPNQVLVFLASMLAASILLIFGTNIYRGLRRLVAALHRSTAEPAITGTEAVPRPILAEIALAPVVTADIPAKKTKVAKPKKPAKAPESLPVVVIELPKRPSKALLLLRIANTLFGLLLHSVADGARKHFPRLVAVLARSGTAVKRIVHRELQLLGLAGKVCVVVGFRGLHAAYQFVGVVIHKTVSFGVAAGRWVAVGIIVLTAQTAQLMVRSTVRFWRWSEPHLRTFDAWLGVHYNRGLEAGRARVTQSDSYRSGMRSWRRTLRLLAGMRDDLRAAIARTPEK